jgi:hypothetical protein
MKLNLPPVPITDLNIRHDSLVVATQGRGYWVLDDLFVVRQGQQAESDKLRVFAPGTVTMLQSAGGADDFEGSNPATGAPIYYQLPADAKAVQIEIFDNAGKLIRTYSSEETDFDRCRVANMDPRSPFELEFPSKTKGLNQWNWNYRSENLHCIEDVKVFAGFSGTSVLPGEYRMKVTAGDQSAEAPFTLVADPRLTATAEEMQEWSARANEAADMLNQALRSLDQVRKSRGQIETLMADYPDQTELQTTGKAAIAAITAWDHQINQHLHQTYEDEDAWETMLAGQIRYLLDVIDGTGAPVTGGQLERLADLKAEWATRQAELQNITNQHLQPINDWARTQGVSYVSKPE